MTFPTPEKVAEWTTPPKDEPGRQTFRFYTEDFAYVLPPGKVTKPTVVFGVYCPASFRVEGLNYDVKFVIRSSSDRAKDIAITELAIVAEKSSSVTTPGLESIPAGKLLAAALNAAEVTLIAYPPNYNGQRLTIGDGGALIPVPDNPLQTDDKVRVFPVISNPVPMPSNFPKSDAGVEQLVSEKRLREVARIVKGTDVTGWTRKVAQRFNIDPRHARRLIQEARDAKFLPPLPPTDKRTRRNKS